LPTYTATSTSFIGNIESYSTSTNTVRAITQVAPFGWVMRPYGSFDGKVSTTQFIANATVNVGSIVGYANTEYTPEIFTANVNVSISGIKSQSQLSNIVPVFTSSVNVNVGSIKCYSNAMYNLYMYSTTVDVNVGSIYGYGRCKIIVPTSIHNFNNFYIGLKSRRLMSLSI
jgi:hypothetical protein